MATALDAKQVVSSEEVLMSEDFCETVRVVAPGYEEKTKGRFMKSFYLLAILWTLPWKGIALWKAARNHQKGWYVAILIIQTLGILEIPTYYSFRGIEIPDMASGIFRIESQWEKERCISRSLR